MMRSRFYNFVSPLFEQKNRFLKKRVVDAIKCPIWCRAPISGTTGDKNSIRESPWWRGWDGKRDPRVVKDIEDAASPWGFDCDGCHVPLRPFHPKNPFLPRQVLVPGEGDGNMKQLVLTAILAAGTGAAVAWLLNRQK